MVTRRVDWSSRDWWCTAALLFLTAIPYLQVVGFDFVELDDRQYITESPLVQQGLNPLAMWDALVEFHADNWHPLVWWSLMLDFQLFGNNPAVFHLVNVAWHLINVVLLFAALKDLTQDTWRSALVAAIFGVHPLHVESVAWITERKDVLSGFFWMLGLWSYSRWSRSPGSRVWWVCVTLSVIGGLLSKQIIVTLPCVFLLLDAWPLKRYLDARLGPTIASRIWRLCLEKLPWFGLCLAASMLAMNAQQTAKLAEGNWPLSIRLSNAVISVFRYLGKTIYPVGLSIQYPFDLPTSQMIVVAAAIALAVLTIAFFVAARRHPALLFGWLWFLGTLMPVIGLIQVGKQSMADRYMYLPMIGLSIGLIWSIPSPQSRSSAWFAAVVAGMGLMAMAAVATVQVSVWRNTSTLYDHAVTVDPTNEAAHYSIGFRALEAGNVATGLAHLHSAVEWDRKRWEARQAYSDKRYQKQSEELKHRWSEIYMTLGRAEAMQHEPQMAIADFRAAVSLSPTSHEARMALGMALADAGENDDALAQFEEILKQSPGHPQAAKARSVLMQGRSTTP